jgi:NAD(P)-dependent dehydrogenase (short-subunit alcohol dehydrogenase family)
MAARGDALPSGGGSVINTTSVGATRAMARVPAYMASKAGLAYLT